MEEHLQATALARMAELGQQGAAANEIAHLAQCRACMNAYAEIASVRAEHLAGAPQAPVPRDWLDAARAIVSKQAPAAAPQNATRKPRRVAVQLPAALGLAAVLVLMVWHARQNPVPDEVREAVRTSMRQNSNGSLLFGEDLLPQPNSRRGSRGQEQSAVLADLAAAHPNSSEITYWHIGSLLAAGKLDEAESHLILALDQFDSDSRFHNLQAILDFKRSALPKAEAELQRQAARDSSALSLVNLALTKREMGKFAEAEQLHAAIQRRFPGSPLAQFARNEFKAD